MSAVTAQAIEDSLKKCMDPEVPLNIVEMGLIYGIDVADNNDVNIKMTMTTGVKYDGFGFTGFFTGQSFIHGTANGM